MRFPIFAVAWLSMCSATVTSWAQDLAISSPSSNVDITIRDKDGTERAGGVRLSGVSLLKIERGTLTEQTSEGFHITGNGYWPQLNATVNGHVIILEGAALIVTHAHVPVEIGQPPYDNSNSTPLYEQKAITRFRWEESDFIARNGFRESNFLDLASGVWEKTIYSYAPRQDSNWRIRYLGITPELLKQTFALSRSDTTYHARSEDNRIAAWGADVYLPMCGAKVEILQTKGTDIFPQIWKDKKVPIIWRTSPNAVGKSLQPLPKSKQRHRRVIKRR